jgi:hypothetical protein
LESGHCDIVLGSRFKGLAEILPLIRRVVLHAAVAFMWPTTGLRLTDTHDGPRVMTPEAARRFKIRHNGMAHASEILEQIAQHRMRYEEAPVHIRYTEYSLRKGQRLSNSLRILFDLFLRRFAR